MQLVDIKSIKRKVKLISQVEQYRFIANHKTLVMAKVFQFNEDNIVGYIIRPVDDKNVARYIEKDALEFMMFKNRSFQTADVINVDVVRMTNGKTYLRVRDLGEQKTTENVQKA